MLLVIHCTALHCICNSSEAAEEAEDRLSMESDKRYKRQEEEEEEGRLFDVHSAVAVALIVVVGTVLTVAVMQLYIISESMSEKSRRDVFNHQRQQRQTSS